jgi:CubicO group peptidase (beta-lactamase class C family)
MTVLDSFNKVDTTYSVTEANKQISIRHLLTHTSGISYAFTNPTMNAIYSKSGVNNFGLSHKTITTKEMIELIAQQPLAHDPGDNWTYGLNCEVLGYLVQIVSGKTLGDYCKEYIFEPLSMQDTYFYLPKEKKDRLVPVYFDGLSKGGIQLYPDSTFSYPLYNRDDHFAGGGGASGSTRDYMTFCQMLLDGGTYNNQRILSPKTVDLLISNQLAFMNIDTKNLFGSSGSTFGLGFSVRTQKNQSHSLGSENTYAWGGIFNTKYWIDPQEEMIFVGMTQILPNYHDEFWSKLYNIIYSSIQD